MRLQAVALLVALSLTSGCMSLTSAGSLECEPVDVSVFAPPATEQGDHVQAQGEPVPVMVWVNNTGTGPVEATITLVGDEVVPLMGGDAPAGEQRVDERIPGGGHAFAAFEAMPANGTLELQVSASSTGTVSSVVEAICGEEHRETLTFAPSPTPDRASAGSGALVHTVGVWENGTSFYTNLERYHERSDLPRGDLDDEVNLDPLKVYVYEEEGDQMPERYEQEGYVTTIPGFNENLKRHPTMGASITHLPPDQAYTRDGYEDHRLYGDALVFYVEVVEVREVDCEVPEPVCMPPGGGQPGPGLPPGSP